MSHRLLVTGSTACFRRPEFAVDDISYDVITPMAARRLFEAVHWTPSIWWHIERIEVLNAIRTEWFEQESAQGAERRALCLRNVAYLLSARFTLTAAAGSRDSEGQHSAMFKRRAQAKRFFQMPQLGGSRWPAEVRSVHKDERLPSAYAGKAPVDLGWMTFDRAQEDRERLRYFRPVMSEGVIDLRAIDPVFMAA